jgi:hypothetical protein
VGVKPFDLVWIAGEINARMRHAELVKNPAGNLSIMDRGEYVGWIDLRTAEIHLFTDEDHYEVISRTADEPSPAPAPAADPRP